jgi:hypothetical protein
VALLAIAGAAAFLAHSERRLSERQSASRTFERRAREAVDALAELKAAQQAYVAAGQGVTYWMPRVVNLTESITQTLAALRSMASTQAGASALDEASEAAAALAAVDQRARDYVKSGEQLMAGDVVFTESSRTVATVARAIETARAAEEQDLDVLTAEWRRREAAALAAAAAYAILALVLLVRAPRSVPAASQASQDRSVETPSPDTPWVSSGTAGPTVSGDLPLRGTDARVTAPPATQILPARVESPLLKAAAKLCTEFGRATSSDDMKELLRQVADVIDASGLIVWLAHPSGGDLQPVLAHGYSAQALSRMPTVPRSADNAAAAAYRSGTMQIVLARPGASRGALVAPLLSTNGCIGALSAEISDGGETSDGVQALATIFAAQLAVALASPQAGESRTAASG